MATSFDAGIASAYCVAKGVLTGTPNGRDVTLDITFDCLGYSSAGVANQGVAFGYATVTGGPGSSGSYSGTATGYGTASGTMIVGNVNDGSVTGYGFAYGDLLLQGPKSNWVAWSRIDTLDFTIGRDNVAGEMPMDWKGHVHNIHKLGDNVVAYGENGVSVLSPSGKFYGLNTVHRIGLKGRDAFAGNDFTHYFVDKLGCLYRFSTIKRDKYDPGFKNLDYREFISAMTNPVLTLDTKNDILYICDGSKGYIYSHDSKSFGAGPVNVSGLGYQGGVVYAVSPATITTPPFEICTDIYDFGTSKMKTIYQLEFGTNFTGTFQAAVEYRKNIKTSFTSTAWKTIHERGTVKIVCKGVEFRFKAKLAAYESFELDSFKIDGVVHVH